MNNNNFCINLTKYTVYTYNFGTLRLSTKSQLKLVTLCVLYYTITFLTIQMDIIIFIIIKLIFLLEVKSIIN